MDPLSEAFEERLLEIEAYLDLLDSLEKQVRKGPPKLGDVLITTQQQKILYSSVYLQLYNLVEATITKCVDAVSAAAADGSRWRPKDLTNFLRREWVRATARTHITLNEVNRLDSAVSMCDFLVEAHPVTTWEIEKGGGGNWDDQQIEDITERLGLTLQITNEVFRGVKRKIREDKRPLEYIKYTRNSLAHGNLSFVECGADVNVSDLREIKKLCVLYLKEVVAGFEAYIDGYEFLMPERRPAIGTEK